MSTTTDTDNWTGEGYDAETSTGGGIYLRLKTKGQKVRIRIASSCYRFWDVMTANGETKNLRKCAWIAIHKEVIDGKPAKKVVVFQSSPMVYGLIKDLDESENWGDPTLYDMEITRTEEQGKYYTVTPLPKPMGPISDEEKAMIEAAGIDLKEACKRKSDTGGGAGASGAGAEDHDPFSDE